MKLGLSYLQGKCDRVVFTPVNAPMFFAQTLHTQLASTADIVTPTCNGRGGHPIILQSGVIPQILAYEGRMDCVARSGNVTATSNVLRCRMRAF